MQRTLPGPVVFPEPYNGFAVDYQNRSEGSLNVVNRYRSLVLLVVVLFAQLLGMAYQLRRNQDIPVVRGAVIYVVAPIQKSFGAVLHSARSLWEGYIFFWGTRRQNQSLSGEVDRLKLENQRLRTQAEQGSRLQALFDFRAQLPLPMLAAQVLSSGPSETARILLIDKGSDDGVKPDFPVLVPDGAVGKVLHVFSNSTQVLLITDPYSGVAGLLEGSRVHGILKGKNRAECSLEYVPNGEEVTPGQIVYSSGEDQVFPKGIPLGVVVEARNGPEFQQIQVEPLAQLNRLEEVLIILQSGGEIGDYPMRASGEGEKASGEVNEKLGLLDHDQLEDAPSSGASVVPPAVPSAAEAVPPDVPAVNPSPAVERLPDAVEQPMSVETVPVGPVPDTGTTSP